MSSTGAVTVPAAAPVAGPVGAAAPDLPASFTSAGAAAGVVETTAAACLSAAAAAADDDDIFPRCVGGTVPSIPGTTLMTT